MNRTAQQYIGKLGVFLVLHSYKHKDCKDIIFFMFRYYFKFDIFLFVGVIYLILECN